jgi:hypothetical protein
MFEVRLTNALQAVLLDQFHDALKAGPDIN